MAKVKMPMGSFPATIAKVALDGEVMKIDTNVGKAPNYVGVVSIAMTAQDLKNVKINWAMIKWGMKAAKVVLFSKKKKK